MEAANYFPGEPERAGKANRLTENGGHLTSQERLKIKSKGVSLVTKHVDKNGVKRVTGVKGALKNSQCTCITYGDFLIALLLCRGDMCLGKCFNTCKLNGRHYTREFGVALGKMVKDLDLEP